MNNDLEQEYSKYGIDLSEIERIIAEYTGSSTYDDLRKKTEEDVSSLPTPSEVKEEEPEKPNDGESVFQRRLEEAKTDKIFGLDEEQSEEETEIEEVSSEEAGVSYADVEASEVTPAPEPEIMEYDIPEEEPEPEPIEEEPEEAPSLVKTDGRSVLEQRLSEAHTESVLGLDEVDETIENDFEAEYEEAAEVEAAEVETAEAVEYNEAEAVEVEEAVVEEAAEEEEFNTIERASEGETLESVLADFEAGMEDEDPVVEEKRMGRTSMKLSGRETISSPSDDEDKDTSEKIKTSGLSLSGSSDDKDGAEGGRHRIDRTKLFQARFESHRKEYATTDEDIEAEAAKAEAEKSEGSEQAVAVKEEKNWLGRNWCWILASVITAVFMLVFMVAAKVAPFGGNSFTLVDSMHQYVPFFSIYQDKLKHLGNMGYTWSVGGGLNFQSLLLYYMASPLNLIIIFFSRKGIIAAMSMLVAFKIAFSAGAFSYFLSRRKGKVSCNMIITGLGVAYGLNNYMAGYYWNLMWLDCIMVLPLIVLGFERLMRNHDFRLYVLALCYCLYCNYYISFMICVFLVLWFFAFGHGRDMENFSVKAYMKKFVSNGIRFAWASLLAAGMSCFSLVMAYLAITKTASAHLAFPKFETYGSFFDLFKAQFMLTKPITHMTYDGGVNIYCGVFAVVLFFLYVVSDKIDLWEKLRKLVLLAILFISFNNKFLNYIWHGFHDQYGIPNRFAFLFIFTLLVVGYEAVIRVKKLSSVQIITAGILSLVLLFITYYKVNMATDISAKTILLVSHGMIVVYSVILFLRNKVKNLYKKTTVALGIIMALEIMVNAGIGMGKNDVADGYYHIQYTESTNKAMEAVSEYSQQKQHKFYREDMTDYIMLDENSYNNMRGLGTFCSTVRGDMVTAMGALGYYTGANEYLYMGSTPVTDDLLGVRYIYSRGDRYFPAGEDLPVVYEGDGIKVYENKNAYPIAFQVNDDVLDWDLKGPRVADSINRFAWLACGNTDVFDKCTPSVTVSGVNCTVGLSNDNPEYISYEVTGKEQVIINIVMDVETAGRYFMNIRGNYIDKVVFTLNGEEKSRDRNYIQMFDMGNLNVGDNVSIDVILSGDCSMDGSLNFFLHTLNEESLERLNSTILDKQFICEEFRDGYIRGKIELSKAKILMTSIPYDEGWTVYDNGQKIETLAVGGAFLAVNPGSGVHQLEFKYTPDGLGIGIVVSVIAWIAFFILYIVKKKIDQKHERMYHKKVE